MKIKENMLVKVFFKTGIITEGVVVFWKDKQACLRSVESNNKLLIYKPFKNVMMVKILESFNVEAQNNIPPPNPQQTFVEERAVEELIEEETLTTPYDDMPQNSFENIKHNRTKKLIELRLSENKLNRNKISDKLVDFVSRPVIEKEGKYELPNFTKRGAFVSPSEKNSRGT